MVKPSFQNNLLNLCWPRHTLDDASLYWLQQITVALAFLSVPARAILKHWQPKTHGKIVKPRTFPRVEWFYWMTRWNETTFCPVCQLEPHYSSFNTSHWVSDRWKRQNSDRTLINNLKASKKWKGIGDPRVEIDREKHWPTYFSSKSFYAPNLLSLKSFSVKYTPNESNWKAG